MLFTICQKNEFLIYILFKFFKVAQQEAQRAAFVVDRAKQEKQQKIVQAEGEAQAAFMLGEAISKNPGYLKLRKLRASNQIAKTVSFINRSIKTYVKFFCVCLDFSIPKQSIS